MKDLEEAKKLINDYCYREFGQDADFSDLENVGVTYTTITDDELEVQVSVDLINMQIKFQVESIDDIKFEDITLQDLEWLDFDNLISKCINYLNETVNG